MECPHSGTRKNRPRAASWAHRLFPVAGFAALVWFLVRVLPKPSRAAYPCQRAAAPMAAGFVLWLTGVLGSTLGYRTWKRRLRDGHPGRAWAALAVAAVAALAAAAYWPRTTVQAAYPPTHVAIGEARGIFPGRVVWVHAPEATDWEGFSSSEHWWQSNHTDLAVVEDMVSAAVRGVAGEDTDTAAWNAVFTYFNQRRGKGSIGYQPDEKIVIKINLAVCNASGGQVDPVTYNKLPSIMNRIDNSPQMLLALLRQLVHTVGVAEEDITVGDPTGMFPNYMWNMLHPEFPAVHYLDNYGGSDRTRAEFSEVPVHWSTPLAIGKRQDYLPVSFAQADYVINFAVLKGHSSGITVCAKNHYGSLIRCPNGYLRDVGMQDYYDMHLDLPNPGWSPGTEHYRSLVDLMGHQELGAKTVLHLIDGLFAGYYWEAHPRKWLSPPFGDGVTGDWPSSLFASQDPVAIDSVAYDFLATEWPDVVSGGGYGAGALQGGAEDYLHEAALAHAPFSGTFYDPDADGTALGSLGVHEHWNNSIDKQYSRNRGLTSGIELVALTAGSGPGQAWEIPRGSATIDANLSEWEGAAWIPMTVVAYGNPADVSNARMTVRWDPGNIYAALTVDDAALNLSQGLVTWNGQDDLEVYINANNDDVAGYNGTWVSAQQYFVGPNGTVPPPGLSATAGTGSWSDLGSLHPLPSATFPNAEIEVATSVVGPTITYEMRVPAFSDMPNGVLQNLAINDVVGFDIVVADLGSSYGWLGINAVGSKFANAAGFQDWTLVAGPIDPLSVRTIARVENPTPAVEIEVAWQGLPNRVFSIYKTPDPLTGWPPTPLQADIPVDPSGISSFQDTDLSQTSAYYRVVGHDPN